MRLCSDEKERKRKLERGGGEAVFIAAGDEGGLNHQAPTEDEETVNEHLTIANE